MVICKVGLSRTDDKFCHCSSYFMPVLKHAFMHAFMNAPVHMCMRLCVCVDVHVCVQVYACELKIDPQDVDVRMKWRAIGWLNRTQQRVEHRLEIENGDSLFILHLPIYCVH